MEFKDFKCPSGSDNSGFEDDVIEKVQMNFPEAYTNAEGISMIASVVRENEEGAVCMVPFCHTVEAESYGGNIKLGSAKIGPRCDTPVYKIAEDLKNLPNMDFTSGRLREVIRAISLLKYDGEKVGVEICGPMTTLNNLIDIGTLFKIWRKEPDVVLEVLKKVKAELIKYVDKALEVGADFIAYEDPVGGLNILGPKYFKIVGENFTYPFVKDAIKLIDGRCVMHICPKTSLQLEALGYVSWDEVNLSKKSSYAQACIDLSGKVALVGNVCIHNKNIILNNNKMKVLRLN